MGDGEKAPLRLQFNPKVRLEFHGSTITSDAGLLAFREFDDALGLTEIAEDYLQESRTGRNILHHLVPLLRQSIYSRLAGYDDTNDAVRLSQDPAMRVIVGWQGSERKGASTSEMGQLRLGAECHFLRHPSLSPPFQVISPHPRQVEFPVQQDPPLGRGVGQKYLDLAVLDPPPRADSGGTGAGGRNSLDHRRML